MESRNWKEPNQQPVERSIEGRVVAVVRCRGGGGECLEECDTYLGLEEILSGMI